MRGELLVPLKQYRQVAEMIPYIEKISQPGMKVIFLLPFTGLQSNYCRDRRISWAANVSTRLAAGLPPSYAWQYEKNSYEPRHFSMCEYSWENEKRRLQEKLFPFCDGLRQMGSEIAVDLYNKGDLRKVLRNYWLSRDHCLTIMPCGIGLRIKTLLCRGLSTFRFWKASTYSSALLLSTGLK